MPETKKNMDLFLNPQQDLGWKISWDSFEDTQNCKFQEKSNPKSFWSI